MAVDDRSRDDFGALVGWTSTRSGDRLTLRLQSVRTPPPHSEADVDSRLYMLDRNQAAQLANYLFEMSGHTKPGKRGRGWLARLFG
ncbi:hypothetical protein [Aurantiacibacter marinus]|uniref:hypothetical protein n=1 Tax=Aurantiacibacter marinus TaxID=874156 RepID=UPI00069A0EEF|nr:hypothetical protein [Aurantiacibacter marinus]